MQKPNKLEVDPTARFNEISKQVKRSIELATQSSCTFKFSEPAVDSPFINSAASFPLSNFEFYEPSKRVNHEEENTEDTADDLVKLLSLMSISDSDQSKIELHRSIQQHASNDGSNNTETDVDKTTQQQRLDTANNIQNLPQHSFQFQVDSSTQPSDVGNDNIKMEVVRSIELDSNTTPLAMDNRQNILPEENLEHQPCPYEVDCATQRNIDNNVVPNDDNDNCQRDIDKSTDIDPEPAHLCNEIEQNLMLEKELDPLPLPYQLDSSSRASNVGNDNIQTEVVGSKDMDPEPAHLYNESEQNLMLEKELDPQPLPYQLDSSSRASNVANDNIQTVVVSSTDIDSNTQITNLDIDNSEQNPPPRKQVDNQPLPLLIKHIQSITWPNQEKVHCVPVMELFGQTFETIMVYGTVTSLNVENGGLSQRFVIDDGSGAVTVVWKANTSTIELIKTILHLDAELKSCRQSGLSVMSENWQPNSKECTEMLATFDQIIYYIKREVTKKTKLKLFGNAAVVGKPIRRPGKGIVTLHSCHVLHDSGADRSVEKYHKKNLIRLYDEKYVRS